jgi:signal transduction histidine kinase
LDSALAIELTNGKTAIEFEQIKHKAAQANNHNTLRYLLEELTLLKAHIVIPTFLRLNLMGFLILGESKAQEAFTQEDISVLQVLSNQAGLAIENALFWQRDEEKLVETSKEEAASAVSFGAGHQFNNRLYAISMIIDGIFDMAGDKDIDQMSIEELRALLKKVLIKLKKISEECQFGGQITAGIMSLTGTTPPNFAEFDIVPIITSSIELVEMKHSKDKIEGNRPSVLITNHTPKTLPLVFGSDAQIRDCLFNLIDNAYDAAYEKDSQNSLNSNKLIRWYRSFRLTKLEF